MSLRPMSLVGLKRISKSPEETVSIGEEIAQLLPRDQVVCFTGDLGAGKTTLIKGIAAKITGLPLREINSPTFNYLHIYEGIETLYHFDCYRLNGPQDFLTRGLDEYFGSLCLVEWPERITPILPKDRVMIKIEYHGEKERMIRYEESPL
jgi:tRNA threonylcarbamoyladenosine biosynthesis protein TsaE